MRRDTGQAPEGAKEVVRRETGLVRQLSKAESRAWIAIDRPARVTRASEFSGNPCCWDDAPAASFTARPATVTANSSHGTPAPPAALTPARAANGDN